MLVHIDSALLRISTTILAPAAVLMLSVTGQVFAGDNDDRAALLERIRPVGMVNVTGQPAPAPAAAPAATPAPAAPAPAAVVPVAEAAAPVVEAATAVVAAVTAAAPAADGGAGKEVYSTACFACHATGAAGAPKLADKAAWAPRIEKGMDVLNEHALKGFNAMPPKGGHMHRSDAEIIAAVQYMVDGSK